MFAIYSHARRGSPRCASEILRQWRQPARRIMPGPNREGVAQLIRRIGKILRANFKHDAARYTPAKLLGPRRPLCIEARSIIKRFLRSDSRRGQTGIQIRAPHGLKFRHSFAEKDREAANERVSRAGAVHTRHREWSRVLAAVAAGEQRSVRPERDNHPLNPPADQFLRALLRVVNILP